MPGGRERLAILMALRVKGRAEPAAIATAAEVEEEGAARALADLAAQGQVRQVEGTPLAYALTDAGRATLARLVAAVPGERARLGATYEAFLVADAELKARITDWQLDPRLSPVRLAAVHAAGAAGRALVPQFVGAVPALAVYARRLDRALVHIAAGDARWVASPAVDALHQVWFELHEELLVRLGRERPA